MDNMQGTTVAERITLGQLNITKEEWDKLTDAEKTKKKQDHMKNAEEEAQRNEDFLFEIEYDILQDLKPKTSSTEILEAYRQNKDWRGELFRISEGGLLKFLRKYNLTKKWNDDRRWLFFHYFIKIFWNNLTNPSLFKDLFGVTADDYPGLNLRAASTVPLFPSLRDDKAASMVNDMLNIVELPVIDAKRVTLLKNRQIKETRNRWLRNIFKDNNREVYQKAINLKIQSLNQKRYSLRKAVSDACFACNVDFSGNIESSFKNFFYGNGEIKRGWEVLQDLENALKDLKEKPLNS